MGQSAQRRKSTPEVTKKAQNLRPYVELWKPAVWSEESQTYVTDLLRIKTINSLLLQNRVSWYFYIPDSIMLMGILSSHKIQSYSRLDMLEFEKTHFHFKWKSCAKQTVMMLLKRKNIVQLHEIFLICNLSNHNLTTSSFFFLPYIFSGQTAHDMKCSRKYTEFLQENGFISKNLSSLNSTD